MIIDTDSEEGRALVALAKAVKERWEFYYRMGETCTFDGQGMIPMSVLEELADLAKLPEGL